MRWKCVLLLTAGLAVATAAAKGKKHRHHKPGRDVLDRLASTTISEVKVTSDATSGLVPAPLDVSPYSTVTSNATCGDTGTEEYCRDTPGKRGVVCDICEGIDGSPSRRHPPSHAVDNDPDTWWQSPSVAVSEEYRHVELVARLPAEMELLHVIIKSGPSPRPLAWSLDLSLSESGDDWRVVKTFGDKEHCKRLWDLRPERRRRKARSAQRAIRDDKPTCSTQFTSPRPLENGEMHIGLGEGILGRRVRISFRAAHSAASNQQYYTVRAMTIAARCRCHGYANHCTVDTQGASCSCVPGRCGAQCERCCGAGPAGSAGCERGCTYDDGGDELCVNCTDNRAGPLCDRCLFGYYSKTPDGPCVACTCDPKGSDGSCKWLKKHHKMSCNCHSGFTGARCDRCEATSAEYPECRVAETTPACKCDPKGIVDPSRVCEEVCECKENVIGERCDACAVGHYGLSDALAGGCRRCHCSRLATTCRPDPEPGHDMVLPLGDAWRVSDAQLNQTLELSVDNQGKPYLVSYEVEGWECFYWTTNWWSGSQLSWYGGELRATMSWGVVRGDTGGNPTYGPDAILVGADGTMLAFGNKSHEEPGNTELVIPFLEGEWYVEGEPPAELVDKNQLMDVLSDVRAIMLRAQFHLDQDEVRLESVELRGARPGVREVCVCPAGREGRSCEVCAWTHTRAPLLPAPHAPTYTCLPCDCNGHASCDTVGGPCGPCQHNTTGPHCERCLPGHYGNPVQGPCKPCACPLYEASNNFSPNCALASAEGDEFVCTQCPEGYAGDHCEVCDFGYWGSPTTLGGRCQACSCGGAPCRRDTGECLACAPHREGARCDTCQEGYWFGPAGWSEQRACSACACGAGALAAACDARSGQCACRQGWAGRACDTCAPSHGGVKAGCPLCHCGVGATSAACEPLSGACACAAGAAPPLCDTCLPEHYGLSDTGCLGCNCSTLGAESNACDIRTGQCRCLPHVTGRACDTCEDGYWGLREGGCRRCQCGGGAAACDPRSGACACAPGVTGDNCDTCMPGFYGLGATGCLPCPRCTDGKVCSPESGRCVCPAHARGPRCRDCAPGYWLQRDTCRPCHCGPGALSSTCDVHTGECRCRAGWAGAGCERCQRGHFGPRCRPCHCVAAGTQGCENDQCPCDEYGRCSCKVNVIGDKCGQCRNGTFGLSADNELGCTECFCFGRSAHCSQAGLTRAAIKADVPMHLTLLRGTAPTPIDQDSLLAIHTHSMDATITLPWPPVPVYVELGGRFLGDRVSSYGGWLRFTLEEEGGEPLPDEINNKFPLVRLYGKDIVLDYFQRVPAVNGTHRVRLHESLWSVRGAGGAATSRAGLMLALRAVTRVLLRASASAPTEDNPVHALVLNVSLDTAIPGISRSSPALGVELCECPVGYTASSCQQPALGFWMPPLRVTTTSVAGTIIIQLEGDAKPCDCNGRAVACDPDTGYCLNCSGNTGGARCSECAAGHFGAAGSAAGCQPCPCPSRARNFADTCALHDGLVQCLCKPGYTGAECELCAAGYYRARDGGCAACACDPRGATSPQCDARGRCRCRAHATGDRCDACKPPRTYMDVRGCAACDNCTQTLLDEIEGITSDMRHRADITELSRIPQPFPVLNEYSHNASVLRNQLQHAKADLELARNMDDTISDLEQKEHTLFTEANRIKTDVAKKENEALYLSLESMSGLEEVLKQKRKLGEQVGDLNDFAQGERHLSAHRALKEANHLLRQIKDIRLIDFMMAANDVSDMANLQSTAIQEYNYRIEDAYKRLQSLQAGLEEWSDKSEDWSRLAGGAWAAGDEAELVLRPARARLAALRDVALRCRLMAEDIAAQSPRNLTRDASTSVRAARALCPRLALLGAELADLTRAAEEKEGIYYNLTPLYTHKYLEPAEQHAKYLAHKAQEYKSLFSGSRAAASLGVSAARGWGEVAAAVRAAAAAADSAVLAARTAAQLAGGPAALNHTASLATRSSRKLITDGARVLNKAEDLRNQLEHLRRNADLVSVVLRGLGWQERDLGLRPQANVASKLATSNEQADRVFSATRVLYDEASEVRRIAKYQLRKQLGELQRHGDTALGAAQEHVSQIRGNTERGAEVCAALAAAAAARARGHETAAAALSPRLRSLAGLIARAKHAADSISVSVTSGGGTGCARTYALNGVSASVTRLSIEMSFDGLVRDGPLLYLEDDTQDGNSYMKLTVKTKRLYLSWNLGGAEGVIVHPEELQAAHDDADHTSYKVDIERSVLRAFTILLHSVPTDIVWNSVRLVLEHAGAVTPGVEARNTSTGSAGRVPASPGWLRARRLWLGAPGTLPAHALPACVHALSMDEARLGLWNFVHQPEEAQCTGCTQRWVSAGRGTASLARFSGSGYAELRRSPLRPADSRQFSVSFTVRTRDENALLFMAVDQANNRSVVVCMRACRVVFEVQYGGGARLSIAARGRHCLGRAVHVQAIRVFANNNLEKGSLRVNGEETLGSAAPPVVSAAALPDLSAATYWLGGTPPAAPAPAPPLLGCLGALRVDREGYDPLDTPTRHGVEPSCVEKTLRSAIFSSSGFIELPSPSLTRKSSLGLSFRSMSPDGLLLYRTPTLSTNDVDEDDADDTHYLILELVQGDLQLTASAGKAEVVLRTNKTKYDDKELHTLRVVRAQKQLELWADEEKVSTGVLPGNAFPSRSRGLFLGGLSEAYSAVTERHIAPGFTGTIADFIVDATLMGLETAVEWHGVQLGRAPPPQRAAARTPRPQTLAADDTDCAKRVSYTVEGGAVKFGDAAHSHASLRVSRTKQFALTMHFRTYRDGLLLLAPGSKSKPKHYLALMIKDGKLKLILRGRKRRELTLNTVVADGTWRSVSVTLSRSRAVLSSGGASSTARAPPLSRAARLYVGGLPAPPALPNLPKSVVRLGGLVGCVRRVALGGRAQDLAREPHHVHQCFPAVTPHAYFGGDAYATYSSAWSSSSSDDDEESGVAIELQFRTHEPNGVLVAHGAFVLELKDGAMVLSAGPGVAGRLVWSRGAGGRALCDGAWHAARARWARRGSLQLDAAPPLEAPRALVHDTPHAPHAPLYIGGLPESTDSKEGKENFKGCIKDVSVAGQKREWKQMESIHNVLLDSCPTP